MPAAHERSHRRTRHTTTVATADLAEALARIRAVGGTVTSSQPQAGCWVPQLEDVRARSLTRFPRQPEGGQIRPQRENPSHPSRAHVPDMTLQAEAIGILPVAPEQVLDRAERLTEAQILEVLETPDDRLEDLLALDEAGRRRRGSGPQR